MKASHTATMEPAELQTPVRNRYFYGKLLDVYHCELETNYLNTKRWLLNRLVIGSGVVCGLNVECGQEPNRIVITPGVAIDRWGREIVIPKETAPITIPPDVLYDAAHSREYEHGKNGPSLHVLLCYHECDSDPVPVLAGDCDTSSSCEAGSIREQYRIEFRQGALPHIHHECRIPDVFSDGRIDHGALARWISRPCPKLPDDPCIPLANVRLAGEEGHHCRREDIDITVRRVAYTNRLLFDLLLCQAECCHHGAETEHGSGQENE